MSFTANEYGRDVAAPGLVFPDQPYSTESRCMADSKLTEGGFAVFAKKGEDVKAFSEKPVSDGYFLGVAQRIITRDEYPAGTPVTVVTTGTIWVTAGADVQSGESVGIDASGNFVPYDGESTGAASLTEVKGGTFKTSASNGQYVVVMLK